ncbi:phage tail protein, partial [Streptomyces sp. ActVer]|nr:phage tail protein [Streptomyces sp. ActVer]
DAEAGLNAFNAAVKRTPGAKSVTLKTLSRGAEEILESFGLKVKRLPDGTVKITTQNGQALKGVRDVQGALGRLPRSKTINVTIKHFTQKTTRVITEYQTKYLSGRSQRDITGRAAGGLAPRYADGGSVQFAPNGLIRGPGTGTSDSILALFASGARGAVSDTEFVVNAMSTKKYLPLLEAINKNQLPGFARGGKVTKSEKEARKELGGFTSLSYFGRNAGFKNNEFIKGATQADSVSALVGTMNQMASLIKRSSHGSAETKALRAIGADGSGNPLWKYQRNLESVNKSLEKAKDKLDKLKDSAASLSSSVKSGILSGANITKAAGAEDSQVTINTLLSQMTGSAANSKQFSGMLASLKKKGLSGSLISQIGEAGIEGGGMETAAAILGGGKNEIKKLNALQKQITASATSAGKITADAMYGAGIKAAEGLVKGLQKKQDSIEKQMMKIAKSMEKAIKKALGIKSPSKVMEEVGSFTAEGFAVGMRKNRSVTPAWESMLNVPRGGSMAAKRADAAA